MLIILSAWMVGINIATFIAYGVDRVRARSNRQRISEKTLLVMGLCGGSPGAYIAQRALHHKLRNTTFQHQFTMIVLVQLVALTIVLVAMELGDYSFYNLFHRSHAALL